MQPSGAEAMHNIDIGNVWKVYLYLQHHVLSRDRGSWKACHLKWETFLESPRGVSSGREVASGGVTAACPPSDKRKLGGKEGRIEVLMMRLSDAGGTAGTTIGLWSSRGVRSGRLLRLVVMDTPHHSNSSHP